MSDKPFPGLSRAMTDGLFSNLLGSTTNQKSAEAVTRGFEVFVVNTVRARTKHEEDQLIQKELETLKTSLTQPNVSMVQMRDYLCRMVFCHMLGHNVDFGCIHAVKLAQQGVLIEKKIGYLVCSLLLHRDHELILLLINTIQKDLKSSNLLDNIAALCAASQLVPCEMIPLILPLVLAKLKHQRGFVRQKAVMCLFQFQLLAPDLLEHNQAELEAALMDKDPGVMSAAVHIVHHNIKKSPDKYIGTGDGLIDILRQIISHQMPAMFDYNNIQLPWLQIEIIRCLQILAPLDVTLKKKTAAVLADVLKRTRLKEEMGFAIMYECIQCIISIQAEQPLLDEVAQHVKRYLHSSEPNLKTIGVKMLVSLVRINPEYSTEYQDLIVQSLDNTDISIQRKMFAVLYGIANTSNVEVVCTRLMQQLQTTPDKFWKSDLVNMVMDLVVRFAGNVQWQVDTLFATIQHAGEAVIQTVVNKTIHIIDTSFISSQTPVDDKVKQYLVQKCVAALLTPNTSQELIHISIWVVGELCRYLRNMADDKVISIFTKLLTSPLLPYTIHSAAVTCLQKLLVQSVVQPDSMATQIQECQKCDMSIVIKQRLSVILAICSKKVQLHQDRDVVMDTTLTFMDDLVSTELENGAAPYVPVHLRSSGKAIGSSSPLVKDIYTEIVTETDVLSSNRGRTESTTSSSKLYTERESSGLDLVNVKRVWGAQGRLEATETHDKLDISIENPLSDAEQHGKELAKALFSGLQPITPVPITSMDIPGQEVTTIWEDNDDDTNTTPDLHNHSVSGPWSSTSIHDPGAGAEWSCDSIRNTVSVDSKMSLTAGSIDTSSDVPVQPAGTRKGDMLCNYTEVQSNQGNQHLDTNISCNQDRPLSSDSGIKLATSGGASSSTEDFKSSPVQNQTILMGSKNVPVQETPFPNTSKSEPNERSSAISSPKLQSTDQDFETTLSSMLDTGLAMMRDHNLASESNSFNPDLQTAAVQGDGSVFSGHLDTENIQIKTDSKDTTNQERSGSIYDEETEHVSIYSDERDKIT